MSPIGRFTTWESQGHKQAQRSPGGQKRNGRLTHSVKGGHVLLAVRNLRMGEKEVETSAGHFPAGRVSPDLGRPSTCVGKGCFIVSSGCILVCSYNLTSSRMHLGEGIEVRSTSISMITSKYKDITITLVRRCGMSRVVLSLGTAVALVHVQRPSLPVTLAT